MPRWLLDELLEEVLRCLPPQEPAELVRASLVCRRWCHLVSDPGFYRRFHELHRNPPDAGMLCNLYAYDYVRIVTARCIPTTAFCTPRTDFLDMRVLDARHGRVLCQEGGSVLAVWDPITNEVREFPFPRKSPVRWTAAVLCSAAGSCDHLDCHHGPFLVVFVCSRDRGTFVYTCSSDAPAWSEPDCAEKKYIAGSWRGSALVGNVLYFGSNLMGGTALKFDLELRQASMIQLPSLSHRSPWESVLTTTVDGGLGVINKYDSKLYMWLTKDTQVDAKWERIVIELKTVFPVYVDVTKVGVIGSGVGTIFVKTMVDEVYAFDLKTDKVKKVYVGRNNTIVPYMSFYTPALKGTCTSDGVGPRASHSIA